MIHRSVLVLLWAGFLAISCAPALQTQTVSCDNALVLELVSTEITLATRVAAGDFDPPGRTPVRPPIPSVLTRWLC